MEIPAGVPPTITLTTPQISLTITAGSGGIALTTSGTAVVNALGATT